MDNVVIARAEPEAIQTRQHLLDCFASLAMTGVAEMAVIANP